MARSKYIYVAVWAERVGNSIPVAARTVKHELVYYIAGLPVTCRGDLDVWRVPDGLPLGANTLTFLGTAAEFLAKERP